MDDEKPNYPYVPLPRTPRPLPETDQKRLAEFMTEWEAELIGDCPTTGGFTEWLKAKR
jgi:hypothetical protein